MCLWGAEAVGARKFPLLGTENTSLVVPLSVGCVGGDQWHVRPGWSRGNCPSSMWAEAEIALSAPGHCLKAKGAFGVFNFCEKPQTASWSRIPTAASGLVQSGLWALPTLSVLEEGSCSWGQHRSVWAHWVPVCVGCAGLSSLGKPY